MNKLVLIVFLSFLSVAGVRAQETFIFEPKYLKGERADHVISFIRNAVVGINIHYDPVLNLIAIPANDQERLRSASTLLRRFDVPETVQAERQIEMTVHLIRAFTNPARVPADNPMPAELEPALKEMKASLPYVGYKLAATIPVTVRDGLVIQDALPVEAANNSISHFYTLEFVGPSVGSDGKSLSLKKFHFGVKVPIGMAGTNYQDVGISTSLMIREGQKLVLGKLTLQSMSAEPIFLILTAKFR